MDRVEWCVRKRVRSRFAYEADRIGARDPGWRTVKRLSCQEVLDQLSEYLDDEARAELVQQVDVHLHECSHCQVEVDTLRRTIMIYRCDEKVAIPTPLSEKLQDALDQAYRASRPDPGPLDV
jgi:anti-sigma factor (TIGR02949 family)